MVLMLERTAEAVAKELCADEVREFDRDMARALLSAAFDPNDESLVEIAAKGIWNAAAEMDSGVKRSMQAQHWENIDSTGRAPWLHYARCAINAMRNSTSQTKQD